MTVTEAGLHLPAGVEIPTVGPVGPGQVVIDNRTDLPDVQIEGAVKDFFVENASLAWGHQGNFATYANEGGGMLARTKFRMPRDVFDEIRLARDIADRDDDVRSTIGGMIATAYEGGMQNFHEDERTVAYFNEVAKKMNLDHLCKEMYREYLIAGQVNTINLFTRGRVSFVPDGTSERVEERLATPLMGILPAEDIRVINNDIFGMGDLAYLPPDAKLRRWLEEFFSDSTTPARKNAMRAEDPVAAALFLRPIKMEERDSILGTSVTVYVLNPRMASRVTMAKGSNAYPRPLLTANFALIEAKRLLNVMDYALLQGGANFIVVAKKGSDQHRASQPELNELGATVAKASRTGVIVGDHRLSFEIITPKLEELLNAEKRRLIGQKLSTTLLRIPEPTADAGTEGQKMWVEIATRVITSDRNDIKRHIERTTYDETATRNVRVFKTGAPKVWHPKIILQGAQFFQDMVMTLRDRGDIPRKFAVEAAGFDWDAGVAQRKREKASGADDIMVPASVPFDSPQNRSGGTPGSDGGNGRPRGAGDGSRPDPAAPKRPARGPGETVRAWWDEELADTVRVGEVTYRLLEQYPERDDGRITQMERAALESGEIATEGAVTVIPVNHGHQTYGERVVRLAPGLGAVLGYRTQDDALVTKALSFRKPEFDEVAAEELALALGFERPAVPELPEPKDD